MLNYNIFVRCETFLIILVIWFFQLLVIVWCTQSWQFISMMISWSCLVKNLNNILSLLVATIDSISFLILCFRTAFHNNFRVFYLLICINLSSLRLFYRIRSLDREKFINFVCDKLSYKKEREPYQMNINCENWGLHYAWTWT